MTQLASKIFLISILLINVLGVNPISGGAGKKNLQVVKKMSANMDTSFVIGGFDFSRGGNGGSIQYGAYFSHARSSIAANLPDPMFVSFPTLTSDSLNGVDVLLLTSTYDISTAISPLTAKEQEVLLDYIKTGGCAILMTDNSGFGGYPESSLANQSIIDSFGLTTDGFIPDKITSTILHPSISLITSGPYGKIAAFSQYFAGFFTSDGIYATRLANNIFGGSLDVINADVIQPGSGPVVLYSDANTFFNEEFSGAYYDNENLFMNSIHFCYLRNSSTLYKISGRVTDLGGKGIPNVEVSALKSGRATTDAQGYYTISALQAGSYVLEANRIFVEFEPKQFIVNLPPDSIEHDFIGKFALSIFLPSITN